MAVRLLFVLGIAAVFLVLAPESASAHCHEPTAYSFEQAAGDATASDASGACGPQARKGGFLAGLGVTLSTAGYAAAGWTITRLVRAERIASTAVSAAVKPPNVAPVVRIQKPPPPNRAQRRMLQQKQDREFRRSKRARWASIRELRDAAQQIRRDPRAAKDMLRRERAAQELISRSERAAREGHALSEKARRLARTSGRGAESGSAQRITKQAGRALRRSDELACRAEELLGTDGTRRPARPLGGQPRRPTDGMSEGEYVRLHWPDLRLKAEEGWDEGTKIGERIGEGVGEVVGKVSGDEQVGTAVAKVIENGAGVWGATRRISDDWPY